VNAARVRLTGKKAEQEVFYYHTGFPGGIKGRTFGQRLASAHNTEKAEVAEAIRKLVRVSGQ
jgi:large subunit ribosomal protein L13